MLSIIHKSMRNRKFTITLTLLSIGLSVTLLLGVERIRTEARNSFTSTVSGMDLVVGARSGPVQLLLYSVFHLGNATNNISWESYRDVATNPQVKWTVPISLGDSHRGYRVMGTNTDYFTHFRYSNKQQLELSRGAVFSDIFDVVLGAEVAEKLNYSLGDSVVIAHGVGKVSFIKHDNKPFIVCGILKKTGTPVDKTLHVRLEGIEAIHIDWQDGRPAPGHSIPAAYVRKMDLNPKLITAFFVGLKSRTASFKIQRYINQYPHEPLLAVLPGIALQKLWDLIGIAEKALIIVSGFVVVAGLLGMLISLMTSLNERRREMAILRSVGASPYHVFTLVLAESAILTVSGIISGVVALYILLFSCRSFILNKFGIFINLNGLSTNDLILLSLILCCGLLIGLIPGYQIYRYSLSDGMTIRI